MFLAVGGGINLVENILSIFANSITIKQHLGGQPPTAVTPSEDGMTVTIENATGNITIVDQRTFNIYVDNPKIDTFLSKGFAAIQKDEAVESVSIKSAEGEVLVKVEEEAFPAMSTPGLATEPAERRVVNKEGVFLRAFKISFEEGIKWGFVYEGNKIQAGISDPEFLKRIDDNEAFAKGDMLRVNLAILQEYDKGVQEYINKGFEVTALIDHIQGGVQGNLFGNRP